MFASASNNTINAPQDWDIGTGVKGYVWQADHPRAVLLLQHGYGEYAQRYAQQYLHLCACYRSRLPRFSRLFLCSHH